MEQEIKYAESVMNSDLPRTYQQYWVRKIAKNIVKILGLNSPSMLKTEFVQCLEPITEVKIGNAKSIKFTVTHGRLSWRVNTFQLEEPETIKWLQTLQPGDCLWDVGANVGMFSLYAAVVRNCDVVAFEPEAQNFAILMQNIDLNKINDKVKPVMCAVAQKSGLGKLKVPYLTKGGAFNQFQHEGDINKKNIFEPRGGKYELTQYMSSLSLDECLNYGFKQPTHLKIDVDGIESEIIKGADYFLKTPTLKGILIELNENLDEDVSVINTIKSYGFNLISSKSNWDFRKDRSLEEVYKAKNFIFSRSKI